MALQLAQRMTCLEKRTVTPHPALIDGGPHREQRAAAQVQRFIQIEQNRSAVIQNRGDGGFWRYVVSRSDVGAFHGAPTETKRGAVSRARGWRCSRLRSVAQGRSTQRRIGSATANVRTAPTSVSQIQLKCGQCLASPKRIT
jgi:hypothetical protein